MLKAAPLLLLTALVGCEESVQQQGGEPSSPARVAPTASIPTSAEAPAPESPHAGGWTANFKAEPGEVTVPEGVPYKSWKEDPGGFEGDNTLEITIAGDGSVTGKSTGSLGVLFVRGQLEEGTLSVGLSPEDPKGMTGVLTGKLQDGAITGDLRVSNADASVVRKASFALKKK